MDSNFDVMRKNRSQKIHEFGVPHLLFWWWCTTFFFINFSGVDVTANQEEISDHETFQLEFDDKSKRWYMRTMQDKFFTLGGAGGIQAKEVRRLDKFLFSLFFSFLKEKRFKWRGKLFMGDLMGTGRQVLVVLKFELHFV